MLQILILLVSIMQIWMQQSPMNSFQPIGDCVSMLYFTCNYCISLSGAQDGVLNQTPDSPYQQMLSLIFS